MRFTENELMNANDSQFNYFIIKSIDYMKSTYA